MRLLITGAPGWLGNRLLEILVQGWDLPGPLNDWDLRCTVLPNMDRSLLQELSRLKPIECVEGDILNPESLTKAVKDVDVVYHIAGLIHPKRIQEVFEVNTRGTQILLDACSRTRVKRLLYISSNSAAGVN